MRKSTKEFFRKHGGIPGKTPVRYLDPPKRIGVDPAMGIETTAQLRSLQNAIDDYVACKFGGAINDVAGHAALVRRMSTEGDAP